MTRLEKKFEKYKKDPCKYIEKYVAPKAYGGKLHSYCRDIIEETVAGRSLVVKAARQKGVTTASLSAILHKMLFDKDQSIVLVVVNKDHVDSSLRWLCEFIYDRKKFINQPLLALNYNKQTNTITFGSNVVRAVTYARATELFSSGASSYITNPNLLVMMDSAFGDTRWLDEGRVQPECVLECSCLSGVSQTSSRFQSRHTEALKVGRATTISWEAGLPSPEYTRVVNETIQWRSEEIKRNEYF